MRATIAAALLLAACVPTPSPSPVPSPSATAAPSPSASPVSAGCILPSDVAAHVYHAYRLTVLNPCATVVGTIVRIRLEADGDYHIQVQPDPASLDPTGGHWVNARNVSGQSGYLIVEPVCETHVTQADAVATCAGYVNPIKVPPVGSHVTATGPWVLDRDHGWQEIHPAEVLVVFCSTRVAWLTAITLAPGTTAPAWSRIVPFRVPTDPCPQTVGIVAMRKKVKTIALKLRGIRGSFKTISICGPQKPGNRTPKSVRSALILELLLRSGVLQND